MNLILVFAGGGLGCVCRYLIGVFFQKQLSLPIATFISNLSACIIFALVLILSQGKSNAPVMRMLLLTGFCGGLSTFSTFGYETFLLLRNGQSLLAITNMVASIGLCTFVFYIFRNQF